MFSNVPVASRPQTYYPHNLHYSQLLRWFFAIFLFSSPIIVNVIGGVLITELAFVVGISHHWTSLGISKSSFTFTDLSLFSSAVFGLSILQWLRSFPQHKLFSDQASIIFCCLLCTEQFLKILTVFNYSLKYFIVAFVIFVFLALLSKSCCFVTKNKKHTGSVGNVQSIWFLWHVFSHFVLLHFSFL